MSEFLIDNGKLVKYTGAGGEIVVPDGVTEIGEFAFSDSSITGAALPKSLQRIGNGAFQGCRNLRRISIPNTVISIGVAAFKECGIETLVLPQKLREISDSAFESSKLREISVPKTAKTIGYDAFRNCRCLEKVEFPVNLKEIHNGAFWNCSALREINNPPSAYINNSAFDGCTSLMDDEGFMVVEGALFNSPGLYKSHTVKLPEGIRVIRSFSIDIRRELDGVLWASTREELFRARKEKVGSVIVIPASVEKYESSAFMGDIEEIISHSTASFTCLTMSGCRKLKKITVPEGAEISENIFGFSEEAIALYKKLKVCFVPKGTNNSSI